MPSPVPLGSLGDALVSVWAQTLVEGRGKVKLGGQLLEVVRTPKKGLRSVYLSFGEIKIEGIEQNPSTSSRWAKLARAGQRIMQFSYRGRYVGNVCEGTLPRYPSWASLGLPP